MMAVMTASVPKVLFLQTLASICVCGFFFFFVSLTTVILTGMMGHEAHMLTDSTRECLAGLVKPMGFVLQQKKLAGWSGCCLIT